MCADIFPIHALNRVVFRALQPGQRYLLYHCQCTITTRGRFYHPALMLSRTRFYDRWEFSAPFANPVYKGSFNVMRESAGRPARARVYPIFHQFMVTLAGLALYADSDDSCELGLGQRNLPPMLETLPDKRLTRRTQTTTSANS